MVSGKQILQLFVSILVICGLAYICYSGFRYWHANNDRTLAGMSPMATLLPRLASEPPFSCTSQLASFTDGSTISLWYANGQVRIQRVMPTQNDAISYLITKDEFEAWTKSGTTVYQSDVNNLAALPQALSIPLVTAWGSCQPMWSVNNQYFDLPIDKDIETVGS